MGPQQAAAAGLGRQPQAVASGALVTVRSNALERGSRFELNAKAITVGRAAANDIRLDDDEFASSLEACTSSLERGNTNAARNQLGAFQNKVSAQRGKKLTNAQADVLLQQAAKALQMM